MESEYCQLDGRERLYPVKYCLLHYVRRLAASRVVCLLEVLAATPGKYPVADLAASRDLHLAANRGLHLVAALFEHPAAIRVGRLG